MADKDTINLVVITPERQVVDARVASVVFTAHDGEIGVLTDRSPLMCALNIGQVRYPEGSATRRVFIDGGFAQVNQNDVTILTNRALRAEDVSADVVAQAEQDVKAIEGHEPATMVAREEAQQRLRVLQGLREGGR